MKKLMFLLIMFFVNISTNQSIAQESNNIASWLRYPAISPNGSEIAFSYKGDLYLVPVTGGRASRLTTNIAYDYNPVWSNDGSKIAFSSDRYGNDDVFVINKEGGIPKRITFHSADDRVTAFSGNDQTVLFSSNRLDAINSLNYYRMPELYSIDLEGGMPKQIFSHPAMNARYTSSGDILFEELTGRENEFRKHHTSSVTRDLWRYKADGTYTKIADYIGEDRNPAPTSTDDFYYLSERGGTFNVFKSNLTNPNSLEQVSNFTMHPVRYLSASKEGLLCYSFNGDLYTQQPGAEPVKLNIEILADETTSTSKLLSVSSGASEMVPSPNGKEIFFVYRGEVFVTAVDGSLTKQITNTPEQERSIDISPDGKTIVYASERNNSWNLYTTRLANEKENYFVNSTDLKEETLLASLNETFQPSFSPDGKEVAFLEARVQLKVITIENKKVRTIHDGSYNYSYLDGDQSYSWSPDGKWFLFEFNPPQKWSSEIGLKKSDGTGEIFNLSKSGFSDSGPIWSADGSMIIWSSNKEGLRDKANSGSSEYDLYALFLTQKAYDKYSLSKEEYDLLPKEDEKKDKEAGDKKEDKEKKEKIKLEPVKIDFEGLTDRKEKLTIFSSRLSDAVATKDGKNILFFAKTGKNYDLWKIDLVKKESKVLTVFGKSGGSIKLDKEGKNLFVLSDGSISKVKIEDGSKEDISISGEMRLNEDAERAYLFDHVARQVKKKFLDKELHGAPWDTLTANYKMFLPHISNNFDFTDMLSELLGELNASHTGARFSPSNPKGDITAALAAFYSSAYDKDGLMIEEIMVGSPLVQDSSKIKPGIVIEKIDGKTILKGKNYYSLLNRKADKTLLLSLYNPETKARWTEKVKPISIDKENELRYKRWIKQNRKLAHTLSDNKIGYMHIKEMGDESFREFLDEVMGEEYNKEALIVDTRNNSGGDLVDDLTTFLSGMQYQTFKFEDKIVGYESQYKWTKPSIMLVCEANYSDAHCVPAAYHDQELGKIVGMPVPGTCSFVWWEKLQNGVVFGIPNMAVINTSGEILENNQLEPDFKVKNDFTKISNGEDQQIAKAVEELLKGLK